MWFIEALQLFGSLNLAPVAITGATVVLAAAAGLVLSEKKKVVPATETVNSELI